MTPKILLVDDKPANLYALKAVLAELDVDLIDTTSPVDALELVLEHTIALAIIDVQMQEMNGFELVSLMQGYFGSDMPPVIFVSAIYTDTSNFLQGYQAGAVDFMSKPFVPEILLSKVRVFLDLYLQKMQLGELVGTLESQKTRLEREVEQQLHVLGGVTTGITELKRTSEVLETFKTLVEYASDGICIASDGGVISYANRAFYEMFGFNYQQHDLHDVPLASLFPMPEARYVSRIIDHLRQGKTRRGESRQQRADESIFFSEYTAFPLSFISPELQASGIDN